MDVLLDQLTSVDLPSEIIITDWNPPPGRLLKDVLVFPASHPTTRIRLLTVSNRIHRLFQDTDLRPTHPAAAMNTGLRRAAGTFLVCKGSDTFYSEPVLKAIARKTLELNTLYRCDRVDIEPDIVTKLGSTTDRRQILESCITRHDVRHKAEIVEPMWYSGLPRLHTNASGDFMLVDRATWFKVRGFLEDDSAACNYTDGLTQYAMHGSGTKEFCFGEDAVCIKPTHSNQFKSSIEQIMPDWAVELEQRVKETKPAARHTPILRALRLRLNYPKYKRKGFEEIEFPCWDRYERKFRWLANGKMSHVLNGEDWGLGNENLPAIHLCRADWEN